jgi:hypothetical protein
MMNWSDKFTSRPAKIGAIVAGGVLAIGLAQLTHQASLAILQSGIGD